MRKYGIKVLALIGILSFATICSAHEYRDFKQKTVIQHKTNYYYSNDEIEMFEGATDVVNKYWDSSDGAEATYNLFTENYKNKLKQTKKINNALDYINYMYPHELAWRKQTYVKAWIEDNKIVKIVLLAEWSQEGYEGVYVFTFDMVKEGDNWKIENIVRC